MAFTIAFSMGLSFAAVIYQAFNNLRDIADHEPIPMGCSALRIQQFLIATNSWVYNEQRF